MESVKELVDGYCQITGRPSFTITVDEYIKFHQLAALQTPFPWREERREERKEERRDGKEALPSVSSPTEEGKREEKEKEKVLTPSVPAKKEPFVKKEGKPVEKKEERPKPSQADTALALLKSISG